MKGSPRRGQDQDRRFGGKSVNRVTDRLAVGSARLGLDDQGVEAGEPTA